MLIVAYDIKDDKLRTKFSKFLSKFGYRLQYSVFQIKHSKRMLSLINIEIEDNFGKKFCETDSVIIFQMSESCKTIKFGYCKNDDGDLIIV